MEIHNFHNIRVFKTYVSLTYMLKHIEQFCKNYKSTLNIISKCFTKKFVPRKIGLAMFKVFRYLLS
ncbi:hypothetical protein Taro_039858 [Colocasia esculenta]|uniref:Uncharacterized protein n=1 Tax=Colocasia esculenta TaxID=4460 RepID=A0A843WNG6_COLES|nr:hypothetical protein [Colocasia esculenta]